MSTSPRYPSYRPTRFDLNGDGFTGESTRVRPFDLDRTGSTRFGASTFDVVSVQTDGRRHAFDERRLTDLEILCYYARLKRESTRIL